MIRWAPIIKNDRLQKVPELTDVSSDRQQGGLQVNVHVDRVAASRLGVRAQRHPERAQQCVRAATGVDALHPAQPVSGDPRNRPAIPARPDRSRPHLRARRRRRVQVPLSAVTTIERGLQPLVINHQGQFPAVTISFSLAPNVTIEQATQAVDRAVAELHMSDTVRAEFQGDARAYRSSIGTQPLLLILAALLAVYIVLGVLYESLAHPLTIISTLPSAGLGALLALQIFQTELSLIALIGIILLIGIVKKNGIILVDFALDAERNRGLEQEQAVFEACLEHFPADLDDHLGGAARRAAAGVRERAGLGDAPSARHHHRWRADRVADAHALHDAGDLSLARPPAPPAVGRAGAPRARSGPARRGADAEAVAPTASSPASPRSRRRASSSGRPDRGSARDRSR